MYFIVELQVNGDSGANIVQTADTYEKAMSKYHTVLASASVSEVEKHSCIVLDDEGRHMARECYKHIKEPEPTPEPTVEE